MLTVSAGLAAAQRARSKRPALSLTVSQARFSVPILEFSLIATGAEPDCPIATVAVENGYAFSVRNNAGALEWRENQFTAWTTLPPIDTVTAGQGFALAVIPGTGILLAYGDGNDLKASLFNGISWSAPGTLASEASAIGSVAMAWRTASDGCVFYTLGTSSTLKRLRLGSPSTPVTWSKTASVASITGLSVVLRDDYYLIVTGTEATTNNPRVWAVAMGDTNRPTDAWSALVTVQEADAAASVAFSAPHAVDVQPTGAAEPVAFVTFVTDYSGNVPYTRPFLTHSLPGSDLTGQWREPYPVTLDTGETSGASLAFYSDGFGADVVYLITPTNDFEAVILPPADLSPRVLRASARITPTALAVTVELEGVNPDNLEPSNTNANLKVGYDLTLSPGYFVAGTAEYGVTIPANIHRTTLRFDPPTGKRLLVVEASGPWEALARYHQPQAWASSTMTRGQVFARLAGRAGLAIAADGALPPSTAWADTTSFAIGFGENAKATLLRLLNPTPDMLRINAAGQFSICGLDFGLSPPAGNVADYGWPADAADPNPLLSASFIASHEANWFRVTGADRYADAFLIDDEDIDPDNYPSLTPNIHHIRDLDVNNNTEATDAAAFAMRRSRAALIVAEAVVPANVAHELFDIVRLDVDPAPNTSSSYRILELSFDFRRRPASGAPAYLSTFGLGRV